MNINWFPGHMAKSMRLLEENVKLVDVVVYVLDARVPRSCINPYFNQMLGAKPVLYVLNKADLADPKATAEWLTELNRDGNNAISLNAASSIKSNTVIKTIKNLAAEKIEKWQAKGVKFTPKAMVIGIPNCGKSTIINSLCGSGKTVTGDKPGVTRGKQWVRIEGSIDLLDTPGTLPKKFDDEIAGEHLAFVGSIRDTIIDTASLGLKLIDKLNQIDRNILISRYNVLNSGTNIMILEQIALARGNILKGGEIDFERTANMLIDDFRKCRLGKITLELPIYSGTMSDTTQ